MTYSMPYLAVLVAICLVGGALAYWIDKRAVDKRRRGEAEAKR